MVPRATRNYHKTQKTIIYTSNKRLFYAKSMDQEFYTCKYCFKEFEPKRRRVQKYCSDTCRSKAHHARKTISHLTEKETTKVPEETKPDTKTKIDTVSFAGIGNAMIGNWAADGVKHFLTPTEDKPATRKDLQKLLKTFKLKGRYLPVNNAIKDADGRSAFYDVETGNIVYLYI
ncbi:hypothetical protein OE09_1218 [Flavobacteriaceae bacterium MAR_2010_72]|nr:hypothetical protein OE09_1218 [Flavobacteriaceae bacterium MAR_2010_72]